MAETEMQTKSLGTSPPPEKSEEDPVGSSQCARSQAYVAGLRRSLTTSFSPSSSSVVAWILPFE